ncbi:MAG TPA: DHHA1 domain-containing protein [Candidatus Saccharibacteria bacterium]|nr:DHHA1 domain-containing protein [Candidatus Saccharibacteria bacterium]HRQ06937.1 DHHA1 domain-containing protein [Candidatus Saccharibacteria bacterium]
MSLFDKILASRGFDADSVVEFLNPSYSKLHDPFLLPDMEYAVERLIKAHGSQDKITIYGDYDIDGITATTVLVDAFKSFGFGHVETFIPNRFVEGYGLTIDAIEKIAADGTKLLITVDCGSLSHAEIERSNELGMDVIVTDHHNVAEKQPPAVAVINPKRLLADHPDAYDGFKLRPELTVASARPVVARSGDLATNSLSSAELPVPREARVKQSSTSKELASKSSGLNKGRAEATVSSDLPSTIYHLPSTNPYPFLDISGVGVAFKLVQALQTRLDGLPLGQEKWLLDLVALGTVCDVVTLVDENRSFVYFGLQVLSQTRRPGLRALMSVARVEPGAITARSLGFGLGPRMNAAGRLETATYALEMLLADEVKSAFEKANQLEELNISRRTDQGIIFKEACLQADKLDSDPVLVVSGANWNHGIVGIVAAKLLEKYKKPAFVLQEMGDDSKGSARSYGDFSAADAIKAAKGLVTKGGGHKLAAGVTMPTENIDAFRIKVNEFYDSLKLKNQADLLLPKADADAELNELTEKLVDQIATLEPFGNGNPQPILKSSNLLVLNVRKMGADAQHVKLELKDQAGKTMQFLAFSAPPEFFVEPGKSVSVWYHPGINEWNGSRSVEGRLIHIEHN